MPATIKIHICKSVKLTASKCYLYTKVISHVIPCVTIVSAFHD